MRTAVHAQVDSEAVAGDNPARRMHDHRVANGVTFRVQRLENSQRAEVISLGHHGALSAVDLARLKAKIEPC